MSNNAFLPEDYSAPVSGGKYTKFQQGETRLRILSNPVLGYEYWNTQNKPVRLKDKPNGDPADMRKVSTTGFPEKVKHFWAMIAYNYNTQQIEICQINQASIQADLQKYSRDTDWGHPKLYDIKVSKSGAGKETAYTVVPVPAKPVTDDVKQAYKESPVDLEALFIPGADPFSNTAPQRSPSAVGAAAPAPAPAPAATAPAPVATPAPAQPVGDGRVAVVDDLPF